MRRRVLLIVGAVALLCGLVASAALALLVAPPVPPNLLPPDAVVAQVERAGAGQRRVFARLAQRGGLHDLHKHLTDNGWRLRRVNVLPEDDGQLYFRRSVGGYLLEVALVEPSGRGRGGVVVTYRRCVRHVTCAWR